MSRERRSRAGRGPEAPAPPSTALVWATGATSAALPLGLALEGGGYDLIVRQEVGLAAWWLIALGFAFGVLPRARHPREATVAAAGLAALAGITALGLIDTESAQRTVAELGRLLTYAGLITLALVSLRPDLWRAAAAGLATAALVLPAIALASRLATGAFEGFGADELLGGSRLSYPLGYWNATAVWCAMAFGIGLSISAHARRPTVRALTAAALPLAVAALYLTYSRAGWVALGLASAIVLVAGRHWVSAVAHAGAAALTGGLVVLAIRSAPEIADGTGTDGAWLVALVLAGACLACARVARLTLSRRLDRQASPLRLTPRTGAIGLGGLAAALALALAFGPSIAATSEGGLGGGGYPQVDDDPAERLVRTDDSRGKLWGSALGAFGSDPVSGIGPGSFQFWWERDVAEPKAVRDAHSLYLETLAETGVVGLAALLTLLGGLLVAAVRTCRAAERSSEVGVAAGLLAAFAAFAVHAGVDWTWDFPALAALGLGAAVVAASARSRPARANRALGSLRAAIVAAAVLAGVAEIPGIVGANRARAAEEVFLAGLPDRATELAGDAVSAEPWAADPYALRAAIQLSRDDADAARADVLDAIEREPTNWRHRLLLARVERSAGDSRALDDALDALVELRPAAAPAVERLRAPPGAQATSPQLRLP